MRCLRSRKMCVFYDKSEEINLWGKDLTVALDDVYRKKARCVVLFISKAYARKAWTTLERESTIAVQSRVLVGTSFCLHGSTRRISLA